MNFYSIKQDTYEAYVEAPNPRLAHLHALFIMTVMRGEQAWGSPIALQVVPVHVVAPPWFPHSHFQGLEASIRWVQAPPPVPVQPVLDACA